MTYPPGGSGYPPGQQPTQQFSAPTQQFGKVEQPSQAQGPRQAAAGPSKLPFYLLAAVAVLGLLVYLFSFGPMFTISNTDFPQLGSASGTSLGLGLAVLASVLAALLAGAGLLPKQKTSVGVIAAISVLAFLLVIAEIVNKPDQVSIDWALYVVIACHLPAGGGRDRRPAARRGHHLAARAAAEVRAAAAVRPVRCAGPVLRPARPARAAPGRRPQHSSVPAIRRNTAATLADRPSGGFRRSASRAARRRRRPASRPMASRRRPSSAPTGQVPAQPQPSSSSNQSGNAPS